MTSSQDSTVFMGNTQHLRTSAIASPRSFWQRRRPVRNILEWIHPRYTWVLFALVGFALISGWTKIALTQSTSVTVPAVADTYLKQGTPNANQGAESALRIQQGNRVLLRFDQQSLEQAIGSSNVRSAKLRLYVTANANNWGTNGREVN